VGIFEPSNAMPDLTSASITVIPSASRGGAGNAVQLDALTTFDIDINDKCNGGAATCSDTLVYTWNSPGFTRTVVGAHPTAPEPISGTGTVTVTLTASDPYGASEVRVFNVAVTATGGGGGGSTSGGGVVSTATVGKGQAGSFVTILDNSGAAVNVTIANATTLATSQITCSVSPSLPGASADNKVTILCSTQGQVFARLNPPSASPDGGGAPMLAGMIGITALPLMGMLFMPGKSRRRRLLKMWAAVGLVMLFAMFQVACGGGGASSFGGAPTLTNAGTPAGNYQVVLSSSTSTPATAGVTGSMPNATNGLSAQAPTTFTLTVQ
jgi:hypothetical protein